MKKLQEEAEARQLGIELLKPGDRAELVLGPRKEEPQDQPQDDPREPQEREDQAGEDSATEDRMDGKSSNPL